MHIHLYTYTYTYTYTHTHTRIHTYTYICIQIHMHMHMHIRTHTHTHVYIYPHIHSFACAFGDEHLLRHCLRSGMHPSRRATIDPKSWWENCAPNRPPQSLRDRNTATKQMHLRKKCAKPRNVSARSKQQTRSSLPKSNAKSELDRPAAANATRLVKPNGQSAHDVRLPVTSKSAAYCLAPRDCERLSALHVAICNGYWDFVPVLLAQGTRVVIARSVRMCATLVRSSVGELLWHLACVHVCAVMGICMHASFWVCIYVSIYTCTMRVDLCRQMTA
jgi:hypothetical protein